MTLSYKCFKNSFFCNELFLLKGWGNFKMSPILLYVSEIKNVSKFISVFIINEDFYFFLVTKLNYLKIKKPHLYFRPKNFKSISNFVKIRRKLKKGKFLNNLFL